MKSITVGVKKGAPQELQLASPPLHLLLSPPAALLLLPPPPLLPQLAVGPAGQLATCTFLEGERCPAEEQELPPPVESPVVLLNDHNALQQLPVLLPVLTQSVDKWDLSVKAVSKKVSDIIVEFLYLAM